MRKLLIATTNPGKLKEISSYLSDLSVEVVSLKNFSGIKDVEETGSTFEENALLKARGYYEQIKLPTLADDSGVEIDALNGEPGVVTRRWIDRNRDATDKELVEYTLKRLEGVPYEKRTCRLRSVITFVDGNTTESATGSIEGIIVEKLSAEIEPGYPFRAIMFIPQFNKLYTELTEEEHEAINHRRSALNILKPKIISYLT